MKKKIVNSLHGNSTQVIVPKEKLVLSKGKIFKVRNHTNSAIVQNISVKKTPRSSSR